MIPGIFSGRALVSVQDPYYSSVVFLLHLDDADNTTTPADERGSTWHSGGNAKVSTTSPLTGSGSAVFDGSGDYFETADDSTFEPGSDDFTFEVDVLFTALPASGDAATFLSKWGSSGPLLSYFWYLYNAGGTYTMYFSYTNDGSTSINPSVTWTPSTGVKYKIAVERSGTDLKFYVDDIQQGSTQSITGNIFNATSNLTFGAIASSQYSLNGKLDEVRGTIGVARREQPGYTLIEPYPNS